MPFTTGDNNFGVAKWIVNPTAGQGTHTTIATALTSASSGDTIFISPGTYTENLTLKAGVNLTAFGSDSSQNATGNVIISGTCTLSTAGSVTISGIQLQTNSAALLAVTGSVASIVNLDNCFLNITNNDGITFSSSSASAAINMKDCNGNLGTTGIKIFAHSSAGVLTMINCYFKNSGASTTASTISAGTLTVFTSLFFSPITSSSTASWGMTQSGMDTSAQNVTCATSGGSGAHLFNESSFTSGSASAISNSNTLGLYICYINSTNTNTLTGAGTIQYGLIEYAGSSSGINTTTQTIRPASAFQKVVRQVFTSTGTYTPTAGMKYCDIECIGGGGGGGGAVATGASQVSTGSGGGGGEYARGVFTAATIGTSQAVTIGAAGAANSGAAGGNGGQTSVGSLITANGGVGGLSSTATNPANANASAGGSGGSGGDFRSQGNWGGFAWACFSPAAQLGGPGGNTAYGAGGAVSVVSLANQGTAGAGYGSGGAGSSNYQNLTALAGGAGVKGVVIITEYI